MKISKLSFATERVNLKQGDQCGNYLAFYFFIDGKKIESDDYNPATCWDILDEAALKLKRGFNARNEDLRYIERRYGTA